MWISSREVDLFSVSRVLKYIITLMYNKHNVIIHFRKNVRIKKVRKITFLF